MERRQIAAVIKKCSSHGSQTEVHDMVWLGDLPWKYYIIFLMIMIKMNYWIFSDITLS